VTVPHESTFVEMTNAIDPVAMPEDLPDTLAASIARYGSQQEAPAP